MVDVPSDIWRRLMALTLSAETEAQSPALLQLAPSRDWRGETPLLKSVVALLRLRAISKSADQALEPVWPAVYRQVLAYYQNRGQWLIKRIDAALHPAIGTDPALVPHLAPRWYVIAMWQLVTNPHRVYKKERTRVRSRARVNIAQRPTARHHSLIALYRRNRAERDMLQAQARHAAAAALVNENK